MNVSLDLPAKFGFLLSERKRYKVLYGGRGGAKSWGIARALLVKGLERPIRVACCREIQKSIADSVHQLLKDQIVALGVEAFYKIQETYIEGANGTLFTFHGLRSQNVTSIKSLEGYDYAWVEEAQTVSKKSWDILVPTIRKDDSEIWVSYNPELEEDETHQRFVVKPQPDSIVAKVNWSDNPWFPSVLEKERLALKERDPEAYENVWEGYCRKSIEGAIYANELRKAEKRITTVPVDRAHPVHWVWDLGWADNTSIWGVQAIGLEFRLVDYIQDCQKPLDHYVNLTQGRGYVLGKDILPHDAQAKTLGTGKSIEEMMRSMGRNVAIAPKLSVEEGINAARMVFEACWFDKDKCADGLWCLRHYRYDVDPETKQFSLKPLHDTASHGADAFRYFAVSTGLLKSPFAGKIAYPRVDYA